MFIAISADFCNAQEARVWTLRKKSTKFVAELVEMLPEREIKDRKGKVQKTPAKAMLQLANGEMTTVPLEQLIDEDGVFAKREHERLLAESEKHAEEIEGRWIEQIDRRLRTSTTAIEIKRDGTRFTINYYVAKVKFGEPTERLWSQTMFYRKGSFEFVITRVANIDRGNANNSNPLSKASTRPLPNIRREYRIEPTDIVDGKATTLKMKSTEHATFPGPSPYTRNYEFKRAN